MSESSVVICQQGINWLLHPCILWTKSKNTGGYGHHRLNGKLVTVHRQALIEKLGRPLKPGMLACHHCDIRACYQPEHLYEGTRAENTWDMGARGRPRSRYGPLRYRHPDEKAEIRRLYLAGGVSQSALAIRFGCDQTTVSRAVRHEPFAASALRTGPALLPFILFFRF